MNILIRNNSNDQKYKLMNIEKKNINKIYNLGKNNLDIYYDLNHLNLFLTNKKYNMFNIIYENNIVAFVICEVMNKNRLHINSIAVDKNYRRLGIATYMLSSIKNKFYYYKYITLYVSVNNTKAINLYKKNKFKVKNKINNYYYTLNEDAFVMYYNKNDDKYEEFKNVISYNKYGYLLFCLLFFVLFVIYFK
jgi:ribosomal protein S18 acetylase RimI-like enzyme